MRKTFAISLSILMVFILVPSGAIACRTADLHHYILIDKIINEFQKEPIIAKVEIKGIRRKFNTQFDYEEIIAEAKVIEAVKGSEVGQVIPIMANSDSCLGGLDESDIGKQGFIAGRMFKELFISGRWNNLILKNYRD